MFKITNSNSYIEFTTEVPNTASQIIARIAEEKYNNMPNTTIEEYRESQELLAEARNLNSGMIFESLSFYNVPCELVRPRRVPKDFKKFILYFHGGSWMFGSIDSARPISIILARAANLPVLIVDYRLSPEYRYPAGFIDCYNVYSQLLDIGYNADDIAIFGDSAGGNLSLALLNHLKEKGEPLPCCAALASPVTDMRRESAVVSGDDKLIYVKQEDGEQDIFSIYLAEKYNDKRNLPTISPITADLSGLPPILIHSGELEAITQDNIDFAEKMHRSGGEIHLKIWKDMFHDFTVVGRTLRESRLSIREIANFINEKI